MNGRTWFPVSSGLLSPEHCRNIGAAVWVFLWMIHHQRRPKNGEPDTGMLNAGEPIACAQIGLDLGIPAEYVSSESVAGLGKRYFIVKPIRWTLSVPKNGEGVSPNLTVGVTKNGEANKEQRTQRTTKNKTKAMVFNPTEMELPDWLPVDAWTEFAEHRKETKHPLTERVPRPTSEHFPSFGPKGKTREPSSTKPSLQDGPDFSR
jgi:hypothetical protein